MKKCVSHVVDESPHSLAGPGRHKVDVADGNAVQATEVAALAKHPLTNALGVIVRRQKVNL